MKVQAIEDCFVDNHYRKAGVVFDYFGPTPQKGVGPLLVIEEEPEPAPKRKKRQEQAQPTEQGEPAGQ